MNDKDIIIRVLAYLFVFSMLGVRLPARLAIRFGHQNAFVITMAILGFLASLISLSSIAVRYHYVYNPSDMGMLIIGIIGYIITIGATVLMAKANIIDWKTKRALRVMVNEIPFLSARDDYGWSPDNPVWENTSRTHIRYLQTYEHKPCNLEKVEGKDIYNYKNIPSCAWEEYRIIIDGSVQGTLYVVMPLNGKEIELPWFYPKGTIHSTEQTKLSFYHGQTK